MDPRSIRLLELDKILYRVQEKCGTSMGAALAEIHRPAIDIRDVQLLQQQTREATSLLSYGDAPLHGLADVGEEAGRAARGGALDPKQLFAMALFLDGSSALKRYISKHLAKDSFLALEAQSLVEMPELAKKLRQAVDVDGNVLDTASPELRSIRRKLDQERSRIRDRLDSMVKSPSTQKYLQDPLVTQRGERWCLPVKSEYRAQVPGIVHDQSASGATLFIEPLAIVEITNGIASLQRQEEAEVQRILRELSSEVGAWGREIQWAVQAAGVTDFILARAKYSLAIDGVEPAITHERKLVIRQGRHPLLPRDSVVPTTVELGGQFDVLVITGPNTGGKTVTLKTVGLFAQMAQAGLWLPASEGTQIPIFGQVFADIGDEQSIEQSLSTFSSHMTNIVGIMAKAGQDSLVLLDELGAGTDPDEGAALAIAILEWLRSQGVRVIATTHYSELKTYAWTEPGVENASVEFDVETLRPTYRLLIGTPGKSNAFAIARRLGLEEVIVDRARRLIKTDTRKTEDMLAALEQQRVATEKALQAAAKERREAEATLASYQEQNARLEQQKDKILEQARQKANDLLRSAKFEAEELLRQIREAQRTNVDDLARRVREELKPLPGPERKVEAPGLPPEAKKLKVGQQVKVISLGQTATVLAPPSDGEVQLQVGIMRATVPIADLRLLKETVDTKPLKTITKPQGGGMHFSPELDLRGKLVDESCLEVDKFLDSAMLAGMAQVSIIHGKGTGALGRGIQDYLRTHRAVDSFRFGMPGEGGHGVTVVKLKE
jgi:DNA mismatch repair protein MutS2